MSFYCASWPRVVGNCKGHRSRGAIKWRIRSESYGSQRLQHAPLEMEEWGQVKQLFSF